MRSPPEAAPSPSDTDRVEAIRRRLLDHYDREKRDLPWRGETDPYRVWVSEVMLQQTRVESVVPYYLDWIERFPDVEALAAADRADVLRAWEGLGYYSRARNLHDAARIVAERFDGAVPDTAGTLRELPGVGAYTAGAVASIAFDRPEPAIDGNARRVLARLFDVEKPTPARLRRIADDLVPRDRPGDFNQAIMELGATICAPRSPACGSCPLAPRCESLANGTVDRRPGPRRRAAVSDHDVGVAVVIS
ncbi:MAG: A/G-specific adenine glycosylase, partial [Gemmatimonadota bacterium]|nr:A/G-specific adenine glycosylase [Gemmatimonadota bacterium]